MTFFTKNKNTRNCLLNSEKPLRFDYAYITVIIIISFLFFCHGDLDITARHSYDLLGVIKRGDIFSFYQFALDKAISGGYGEPNPLSGANYNIIIYLTLAAWLFPLKVLGYIFKFTPPPIVLNLYSKLLFLIVLIATIFMFKKIISYFTNNEQRANWGPFLLLTSPIVLYSSTLFSQIDIFTVFFTVIALKYYMQKKFYHFSVVVSMGACFKIFILLVFIPLILLEFKKIISIIKYCAIGFSLLIITGLLSKLDTGYAPTKVYMEVYGFASRIFNSESGSAFGSISLYVFSFIVLCFLSYFIKCDENKKNYTVILPLLSYSLFFILVSWHPSWVVVIYPFVVLTMLMVPDIKSLIFIDFAINISFLFTAIAVFGNHVAFGLTSLGLLPIISGKEASLPDIKGKMEELPYPMKKIFFSVFVAGLFSFVLVSIYSLINKKYIRNTEPVKIQRSLVLSRASIMFVFLIIPSFILFFNS